MSDTGKIRVQTMSGEIKYQGDVGPQGPQGIQGEIGPQGPKGDIGLQGIQGTQGEKGDAFTYEDFTPAQLEALKGPKGDKGDTGDKGPIGEMGPAGKDGISLSHIWNGTTLTITSASGTSSSDLKGDKGDKGDTGPQGEQGIQGPQGDKGEPGVTPTGCEFTSNKVISIDENSTDAQYPTAKAVHTVVSGKADFSSLSTVATSGNYEDLNNKPTIPSEYELPIASATTLGGIKVGANLTIEEDGTLNATGGEGGTTDYTALSNKPKINGIELDGDKTSVDLNLATKDELNDKQDKLVAGDNITIIGNTISAISSETSNILTFENITLETNAWVEDTTYEDFGYKADISCTGVTAEFFSDVVFGVEEAISGNYAPVSLTGAGTVTIYAVKQPESTIIIHSIICSKGA